MLVHRRTLLLCGLFALGVLFCFPMGRNSTQKNIRIEVEMVSLPVVVTTRDGKRMAGLDKEDFQVYEDKIQQKVEGFATADEPFSVALMLDTSGSTMLKLQRIQNEAIRFVNLLPPGDSVAILSLAQDVKLLEDFTVARERIAAAIKRTSPGGYTVLYEAVWLALEEVLKPVHQRSTLVLFTDGVDTASTRASKAETIELAKESRAPIYCIYFNTQDEMQGTYRIPTPPNPRPVSPPIPGVGSSTEDYMGGRQYLANLADYSGGMVFDALKMEDLGPAFDEIAHQLSSQYSIGYYPSNQKHDGRYRRVDVKVLRPGLYVQTKRGYFAPYDKKQK